LKERKPIHLLGGNLTPRQTAPKALLAMRMTCNHDNSVRFWVGAQVILVYVVLSHKGFVFEMLNKENKGCM
jgi:hypothetical protein